MAVNKTTYTRVGSFLKPLGTNGELKMELEDTFWDDVMQGDHLFVRQNGNYVPYFIEYFRETNHILIKLEDIDTPEYAAYFTLKDAYLREKDIHSDAGTVILSKMGWEGYFVVNNGENIGQITEIQEYPQQIMAFVNSDERSIMVPLVNEWIINVDHKAKIVIMTLPDGLVEV